METVRIALQTQTPEYANDFSDVLKLFYHVELFTESTDVPNTEPLQHIFSCTDGNGTSTFTFRGKSFSQTTVLPEKTFEQKLLYKRICKRLCKSSLYMLLKEITGVQPPWGSLTGIRPTRLFYEELAKGADKSQAENNMVKAFDLSLDKAHLLNRIVTQQQLLPSADAQDIDVYISIPFCRTRCVYCSFPGEAIGKGKQIPAYLQALFAEMEQTSELMKQRNLQLRALYIGGGTPSALNENEFDSLIRKTKELFPSAREYTVEVGRPDTITEEKLHSLLRCGFTRISINPQTMNDKTLRIIGRDHTAAQTIEVFRMARKLGFDNINTDVIAGLPGETVADFEHTMNEIIALNPDSLTVHTLAIKHSSRLNLERWPLPDGTAASQMVQLGEETAAALQMEPYYLYRQKYMAGQQQNVGYAKAGKACLYNVDVMEENMSVLAIGAGAISKRVFSNRELRIIRQPNPKNVGQYIERAEELVRKKYEMFQIEERETEMMKYLVALDQGTTSSRAIVFDVHGKVIASHAIEFEQIYPQPGWVEHNPDDILYTQTQALRLAVQKGEIDPSDIVAIGITNQRETTLLWNRETGRCVHNAIVWQCRRTAPYVEKLVEEGKSDVIRKKTGLVPDAYFSGTKLAYLLDTLHLHESAERGELCFGTVDSFLAWNMVEGHPHVTDATNAGRTMLFNLHTQTWDDELLEMLKIPKAVLPKVIDNAQIIGNLRKDILGVEIPVAAMIGDQHASLFGQACFEEGMVKNTYGTGCFMLMNTGDKPIESKNGLVTTMAWRLNNQPTYALEGSVFMGGATIQWLRDELHLIQTASETEAIANSVSDTAGVYLVPAFTGLGAPYWDMYSRGVIIGLTRGANRAHIVRAALEAICYQSNDLLTAMIADNGGKRPLQMNVDGGASANAFMMQFESNIMNMPIKRPKVLETTALGAALLAGLGVGLFKSKEEAAAMVAADAAFEPAMESADREKLLHGWHRAVERSRDWIENP